MAIDETTSSGGSAEITASLSVWSPKYFMTTLAMFSIILLPAFESLAVTTVMPVISAELQGEALYGLTFAMSFATGIIGMVAAGSWSDRFGPKLPLFVSLGTFALGLLMAGAAQSMLFLVAARAVQGVGGGALSVVIYVVLARTYPAVLLPKIFAVFSAAWVLPAIIGPFIAGLIAQQFHWRWVFLGVLVLLPLVTVMMLPSLKSSPQDPQKNTQKTPQKAVEPWLRRLGWSFLAGVAMLVLGMAAEFGGLLSAILAGSGLVVARFAIHHLLPAGALRARRGLPSMVLLRALYSAAFTSADVYIVLALVNFYQFSPALAGLSLTVGAISWSLASQLQACLGEKISHPNAILLDAFSLRAALAITATASALILSPAVLIAAWFLGGAGMGFGLPRLSTLTLGEAIPGNQGSIGSAMSMACLLR